METKTTSGQSSLSHIQPDEYAKRSMPTCLFKKAADKAFAAGSSGNTLNSTAHGMRAMDRVRGVDGVLANYEFEVLSVTTDTFTIGSVLSAALLPSNGDLFDHMRPVTQAVDESGNVLVTTAAHHNEDAPMVSGDSGQLMLGVREDSLGTGSAGSSGTDGDYQASKFTNRGELYVHQQRTIVDQLDTNNGMPGVLKPSTTTIPKRSSNAVSVVASLAAKSTKMQMIDDIGKAIALYEAADKTGFICFLPIIGNAVEVNIAAGTAIFMGAVDDVDITDADTKIMIQFLG